MKQYFYFYERFFVGSNSINIKVVIIDSVKVIKIIKILISLNKKVKKVKDKLRYKGQTYKAEIIADIFKVPYCAILKQVVNDQKLHLIARLGWNEQEKRIISIYLLILF